MTFCFVGIDVSVTLLARTGGFVESCPLTAQIACDIDCGGEVQIAVRDRDIPRAFTLALLVCQF